MVVNKMAADGDERTENRRDAPSPAGWASDLAGWTSRTFIIKQ